MATDQDGQEWEEDITIIDTTIIDQVNFFLKEREKQTTFLNQKTDTWDKGLLEIVLNGLAGELLCKYQEAKKYITKQIKEAKLTKLPYIHKEPNKIDLKIEQKLMEGEWGF